MTTRTAPEDTVDPTTGLSPKEAATAFLEYVPPDWLEGEHAVTPTVVLSDPIVCGQVIERVRLSKPSGIARRDLDRLALGADPDDALRNWFARRQEAADALAEAVRDALKASGGFVSPLRGHGFVGYPIPHTYATRLYDLLAAYDALHAKPEGK